MTMYVLIDIKISYLLYKLQEHQQDQDRHFQLGMLCSCQIFLLKNTFQQGMELVGYCKSNKSYAVSLV